MTRVDVENSLNILDRVRSLTGDVPMGQVLERLKRLKEKRLSQGLTVLSDIWKSIHQESRAVKSVALEHDPLEVASEWLYYITLHERNVHSITSLSYAGQIELFVREEVLNITSNDGMDEFRSAINLVVQGKSYPGKLTVRAAIDDQKSMRTEEEVEAIKEWIKVNKTQMSEGRTPNPFPPGMIADDIRVLAQVQTFLKEREKETNPDVIVLISDDVGLAKTLSTLFDDKRTETGCTEKFRAKIMRWTRDSYVAWCHDCYPLDFDLKDVEIYTNCMAYNIFRGKRVRLGREVIADLLNCLPRNLFGTEDFSKADTINFNLSFVIDIPNVERYYNSFEEFSKCHGEISARKIRHRFLSKPHVSAFENKYKRGITTLCREELERQMRESSAKNKEGKKYFRHREFYDPGLIDRGKKPPPWILRLNETERYVSSDGMSVSSKGSSRDKRWTRGLSYAD